MIIEKKDDKKEQEYVSDGGSSDSNEVMMDTSLDKKQLLMKMLEKQGMGGTKHSFAFEDEDPVQQEKKQRGRPV